MNDPSPTWTIVVAAGSGSRFGGDMPKQFVEVAGRRLVDWSVQAAASVSDGIVVVLPADRVAQFAPAVPGTDRAKRVGVDAGGSAGSDASGIDTGVHGVAGLVPVYAVAGGTSRSESVRCGLAAVPDDVGVVLVHDAARPLATRQLFEQVAAAVRSGAAGAIPAVPVIDTLRHIDGHGVDRSELVAVQTPQGFAASVLRRAHGGGNVATDDATLVTLAGSKVVTVPGERWNLKVTDPTDEFIAAALLRERA